MSAAAPLADGKRTPFADRGEEFSAGRFGMRLLLASLAMLFAASIIGFLVIRLSGSSWPRNLPPLPPVLWVSTALLLLSSGIVQFGLVSIRRDDRAVFKMSMVATLVAGVLFLLLQGLAWWAWLQALGPLAEEGEGARFALSGFYVLTGVHALHVIGGLVALSIVTRNARRDRYTPDDHGAVHYCAMYWHFLDGVWLLLFILLQVGL